MSTVLPLWTAKPASSLALMIGCGLNRLPEKQQAWLARAIGRAASLLLVREYRAVRRNLSLLLGINPPEKKARALALATFVHFARMSEEFLTLSLQKDGDLLQHCTIDGREHFDKALLERHGVILAVPHMGNWDVAARACVALGVPLTVVVGSHWSAAFARPLRMHPSLRVVEQGSAPPFLLRALRHNEAIGLVTDLIAPDARGVSVDFAGRQVSFPEGAAVLSSFTGAPVLPVACLHAEWGRYRIIIAPPLPRPHHRDRHSTGVIATTQALAGHFETFARCFPEQWYAYGYHH